MDKKLPKVFANKVDSKGNNKNTYYSTDNNEEVNFVFDDNDSDKNINQKLNDIFNSSNYIYKADVIIKLKDKTLTKRIVGRNSTHLITMENELIPISDILDIKAK